MTGIYIKLHHFLLRSGNHSSASYRGELKGFQFRLLFILLLLFQFQGFSQDSKINASLDTTQITMGEQLIYTIDVETNSNNLVVFPEGQTFNPMEVVESLQADTTRLQDRYRLIKKYTLTHFDSGSYTIPPQIVLINENPYYTDSLRVEVADVLVDTTKQKMYAIKPAIEVPPAVSIPVWIWWLLGILIVLGAVLFFLRRKRKKQEAAKKLPPYERALFDLQQLDQSHLLENRQTKEYYSKLTEAVRRYLEDEVHLRALESTTSELIAYLELKMDSGELKLSRQTIDELKIILQRADLAKFANSKPDILTARGDRSKIEHVINDTKAAIPEPTEEDLLKDEAYRRKQLKRKNRRKVVMAVAAGILIIVIGVSVLISTLGISTLQDSLFGNPTKELLQGEWITSDYGDPAVTVTTPRVLKRGEIELPPKTRAMMVGNETFVDGSLNSHLHILLTTVKFQQNVQLDLKAAVEGIYNDLEAKGARNMIVKDEEFTTLEGVKGIKVFGTLELEHPVSKRMVSKEYLILNFVERGGFQQITVIFDEDDTYAGEIAGRIINSVEFENTTI